MKDVPVYTVARLTTRLFFGAPTIGVEPLRDKADNILFWERHDIAAHVAAEQNDKSDGCWIVVPRMVRSTRNDVET